MDLDMGRRGMFSDVGQALLHNTIEGRLDGGRQPPSDRAVYVDAQPRAHGHRFREELQGG
jgi:hypothetical protein